MSNCHTTAAPQIASGRRLALVGNPNVGKSLLFHRLTGHYVVVSNYPGTTVELSQGTARSIPDLTVVDTPGIIAFPPHTDDERVTAHVLMHEQFDALMQVGDAKNFRRTIHLTVQLAEMGLPMVLALNMMDEAKACGVEIDSLRLKDFLGLPVIPTIATRRQGVNELEEGIRFAKIPQFRLTYPLPVEDALVALTPLLPDAHIAPRSLGLMWLACDPAASRWLENELTANALIHLKAIRDGLQSTSQQPPAAVIQAAREELIDRIAAEALIDRSDSRANIRSVLSRLTTHPVFGLPILAAVMYVMYLFVGVFGSGTLVGLLEEQFFGQLLNPWVTSLIQRWIPFELVVDFLVGPYGLWTMGMTYALALLLPIATTFFILFGILEDSGYLPRLAVLSNRMFRLLGLNGQAVLPMVLGLGCVTMATITTRILPNRRDRLLVIFLLALAVPCSAQLGVVLGMLSGISFTGSLIWTGVVGGVLLTVGWIAARLMPGQREQLVVELPPLRLPVLSNVLMKTLARLEWYIKEAVPLFLLGTFLLFVLDRVNVLPWLINAGEPLVSGWLGLPAETSASFLLGFLRRDFAATGLFAMQSQGLLTDLQVVVAIVTITLFIPCIASIFMIAKERSAKTALAIGTLIFPFAFLVGGILQRILTWIGWGA